MDHSCGVYGAAEGGHIEILEWLKNYGCPINTEHTTGKQYHADLDKTHYCTTMRLVKDLNDRDDVKNRL